MEQAKVEQLVANKLSIFNKSMQDYLNFQLTVMGKELIQELIQANIQKGVTKNDNPES